MQLQQSETLHLASSTELRAQPYKHQPRTRIDQAPESLIGLPPIRYLILRSSFLYTSRNHICIQSPTSVRPLMQNGWYRVPNFYATFRWLRYP